MKRRIVATLTVMSLACAIGGCIILPLPGSLLSDHNHLADKIGDADSSAPIRVGISTPKRVRKVFGRPEVDGLPGCWYFSEYVCTSVWIWLIPVPVHGGNIQVEKRGYRMRVHFGSDGRVDAYDTW